MESESRRHARHRGIRSDDQMKKRQISVLERHTAIPVRPPQQVGRVGSNLPGNGNESPFIRSQIERVLKAEQSRRDQDINQKKQGWIENGARQPSRRLQDSDDCLS